jgi:hypothetical protein
MKRAFEIAALVSMLTLPLAAQSQQPQTPPPPQPTKLLVEIYRIAPGQHLAFLEAIASYDEANKLAGLPARQLFVHRDGASWDFMLIQPAEIPDDKSEALGKAWEKLGLPSGADFFLDFRRFISSHEDTFVTGPTTAADYLATRKKK